MNQKPKEGTFTSTFKALPLLENNKENQSRIIYYIER